MTNFEMVEDFHDKMWIDKKRKGVHRIIPEKVKMLRVRLMTEELAELIAAMQLNNFTLTADGIADLLYVVYGTAVSYGIPIDDVFKRVHMSNMTKSRSKDEGGKVIKGPDFVPPDLDAVLRGE